MKKLALFLAAVLTVLCLVSCGGGNNNNTPPTPDKPDDKPDQPTNTVTEYIALISPEGSSLDVSSIISAFYEKNNRMLNGLLDSNDPIKGEIVLGDADRDVTRAAIEEYEALLAEQSGDPSAYGGYILYKDETGNLAL